MAVTVAFASDHAGYALKQELIGYVQGLAGGHAALDLGAHDGITSVDYPDMGTVAARAVLDGKAQVAVVVCGSGVGISIAANRHGGIRAALCHNGLMAKLSRQHNDANVLALGARIIGVEVAKDCVAQFLSTSFEGGRHENRVKMLG
jgi:ribose 5-phosphate isomerase B